ncbi:MAG: DUF1801 domain-containing protein [Candidatus Eremiobacteraeota bacterium]|nr:DUF1801 domain-containing protein [Candidatus Eremiobacteraeota bacterium]
MERFVPANFADYARHAAKNARVPLREMRAAIKRVAPEAEETISYKIPAFSQNGSVLVWFAAFKTHIGFYPGAATIAAFDKELAPYKHAKGSVRFPLDRPLPIGLVQRMVKSRLRASTRSRARSNRSGTYGE